MRFHQVDALCSEEQDVLNPTLSGNFPTPGPETIVPVDQTPLVHRHSGWITQVGPNGSLTALAQN
ncbi:MAG: hypothetical protein AAF665_15675 [Pseudomonadota bacterium]